MACGFVTNTKERASITWYDGTIAYSKEKPSKIGPREAQLREMREQRAASKGRKVGTVARAAKKVGKAASAAKKRIAARRGK